MAAAVGVGDDADERAAALVAAGVDMIVVDTAHGHAASVIQTVTRLKRCHDIAVMAGNVATGAATEALIAAGLTASRWVWVRARFAPPEL